MAWGTAHAHRFEHWRTTVSLQPCTVAMGPPAVLLSCYERRCCCQQCCCRCHVLLGMQGAPAESHRPCRPRNASQLAAGHSVALCVAACLQFHALGVPARDTGINEAEIQNMGLVSGLAFFALQTNSSRYLFTKENRVCALSVWPARLGSPVRAVSYQLELLAPAQYMKYQNRQQTSACTGSWAATVEIRTPSTRTQDCR